MGKLQVGLSVIIPAPLPIKLVLVKRVLRKSRDKVLGEQFYRI